MKPMLLLILLSISIHAFSPERETIILSPGERICPFERLINAIVTVESSGDNFAYNQSEGAIGAFQITRIRVLDYNRRTGSNYKLTDFYSYELSRSVFLYYAKGKDFETACRNWNGKWSLTNEYWKRVKKYL